MKIIGISGRKQSGKTTAAEFLIDQYWGAAEALCFADELKDIVCECFGAKGDDLWGDDKGKQTLLPCGKTARRVLQIVGTDWFRSLDPDCWVRAYMGGRRLQIISRYNELIVTPDVRFPNEVKCIQDLGGKVIRLLRCPFPEDKHESETALDRIELSAVGIWEPTTDQVICFDAFIDNRQMSIDEQNEAVWAIVQPWLEEKESENEKS